MEKFNCYGKKYYKYLYEIDIDKDKEYKEYIKRFEEVRNDYSNLPEISSEKEFNSLTKYNQVLYCRYNNYLDKYCKARTKDHHYTCEELAKIPKGEKGISVNLTIEKAKKNYDDKYKATDTDTPEKISVKNADLEEIFRHLQSCERLRSTWTESCSNKSVKTMLTHKYFVTKVVELQEYVKKIIEQNTEKRLKLIEKMKQIRLKEYIEIVKSNPDIELDFNEQSGEPTCFPKAAKLQEIINTIFKEERSCYESDSDLEILFQFGRTPTRALWNKLSTCVKKSLGAGIHKNLLPSCLNKENAKEIKKFYKD